MRSDLNRRRSLGRRQFLTGAAGGLLGRVALPRRGTALLETTGLKEIITLLER
jgi:hypothetical protein